MSDLRRRIMEQARRDREAFERLSPVEQSAIRNEMRSIFHNPGVEFPTPSSNTQEIEP